MSHKYELGTVPPAGARDAVHVAIFAAQAEPGQFFEPGACVKPSKTSPGKVAWATIDDRDQIGVVDPFLNLDVGGETLFWVILNPGTVTDLRHTWSHPALPVLDRVDTPAQRVVTAKEVNGLIADIDKKDAEIKRLRELMESVGRDPDTGKWLEEDDGCRGC